jgi:hypothetical protein
MEYGALQQKAYKNKQAYHYFSFQYSPPFPDIFGRPAFLVRQAITIPLSTALAAG